MEEEDGQNRVRESELSFVRKIIWFSLHMWYLSNSFCWKVIFTNETLLKLFLIGLSI